MYHIHVVLAIIVYISANHFVTTLADLVSDTLVLPDGFSAFGNYEILGFHEDGDEDVIHIRKRAGKEDCGTDCLNYSGWEADEQMHCSSAEQDLEGLDLNELDLDEGVRLRKRERKAAEKVCAGVMIDAALNIEESGFGMISPTWPRVARLEKKYKSVFDIGDPTEPEKPEWFELKKHDQRWTKDIVGRQTKNGNPRPRCYDAEHVIEWQLLKKFIEDDKAKGVDSRCAFMSKFFLEPLPVMMADHKVQAAKNNGELDSNGHFEYEEVDYHFGKWKNNDIPQPRAIDWISHQWPGTAAGAPPNPWEYELVVLNKEANGQKKVLWGGENLLPEPEMVNNKMKEIESNSETIEWLFENKYYQNKAVKKWEDNKGLCKAIYRFNTVMSLANYHNHPLIKEIFRAHVNRIGDAFEYLEKKILVNAIARQNREAFKERGLKKEWLDWMQNTHKERLDGLTSTLEKKIKVFDKTSTIVTKVKRWDYGGIFKRAVSDPDCGSEKDDAKMENRVKLLLDAYKKLTPVDSVLKLD